MHDLLTTQQMEDLLMVDRTTIYRMAKRGDLPAIRVGNQWRFPREEIDAWMAKRSGRALAGAPGVGSGKKHPTSRQAVQSGDESPPVEMFPLECVQMIQDTYADPIPPGIRSPEPAILRGLWMKCCRRPKGAPTTGSSGARWDRTPRFSHGSWRTCWD